MQRFFIHVWNGTGFVPDEEGQELPGPEAAVETAIDSVRSIVSEDARYGLIDLDGRVRVDDARGQTVAELAFRDAFTLRLEGDGS
ncbi:DUF6894 family protein [Sphingomonas sp.]|jgi:hypothetical protein|uniref:DUF6894 family protein n=1 Tax=Sphingomonas sp. TaxID=28214 RepID=UPI002DF16A26|nr:hypothetical protein [Sphingomonas sp.]